MGYSCLKNNFRTKSNILNGSVYESTKMLFVMEFSGVVGKFICNQIYKNLK